MLGLELTNVSKRRLRSSFYIRSLSEIITHYNNVIMGAIASQITSLPIVYSIVYSDADQRKRQSSASLAFVRGIHRGPVNSPHKWPVTRKMFPIATGVQLKRPVSKLGLENWILFVNE